MESERFNPIEQESGDRKETLEGWLREINPDAEVEKYGAYAYVESITVRIRGGFYETIIIRSDDKTFNKSEFQSKFSKAAQKMEKDNRRVAEEEEEWNKGRGMELNEWVKELGIEGLSIHQAHGGPRGASEKLEIRLDGNEVSAIYKLRRRTRDERLFTKEEFLDEVKNQLNPEVSDS